MPLAPLLRRSITLSENLFRTGGWGDQSCPKCHSQSAICKAIRRETFNRQCEQPAPRRPRQIKMNRMKQQELPDLQYSCFAPTVKLPVNVSSSRSTKEDQFGVSIQPAVGELLMPSTMTEQDFCQQQGESQGRQCETHQHT